MKNTAAIVVPLGVTQTIAWASSTYLPAILAEPIAQDIGITRSIVFGAFSVALIVMALAGPAVGKVIDRHGGQRMLVLSNIVLAAGLVLLGCASNVGMLFGAWCILGIGMAMGLYDAAFTTLVRIYAHKARGPIIGITLIAGFASTVGWPLTAWFNSHWGWREACFAWAAINLLIALPINWYSVPASTFIPNMSATSDTNTSTEEVAHAIPPEDRRPFLLLALFSGATAFVTSALAVHLPGLLLAFGTGTAAALTAAALMGPAQVFARLAEYLSANRFKLHPLVTARIATVLHPVGALILAIFGGLPLAAASFAILHGAGNGMITIAKGTLPLSIFGPIGYGFRQGLLAIFARAMQAIAPFSFALIMESFGAFISIALSATLSLLAFVTLLSLKKSQSDVKNY